MSSNTIHHRSKKVSVHSLSDDDRRGNIKDVVEQEPQTVLIKLARRPQNEPNDLRAVRISSCFWPWSRWSRVVRNLGKWGGAATQCNGHENNNCVSTAKLCIKP